ncbi:MAG TPA: class I lanthipeptide [Thermoanaerobaculia bacterium]|nr:class I lanthipeptide [Thermoanaerobaculia bacterium]
MKSKRDKKLSLSAETVRRLNHLEMNEVAGGISTLCTNRPLDCQTTTICTDSCGPLSVCICR